MVTEAAIQAAIDEAHAHERQCDLACTERLLGFFRATDRAVRLAEILDALVQYAGVEVGRAALFTVQGASLRLFQASGLNDSASLPNGFAIAVDEAGLLADVVRSADTVGWSGHAAADAWPSGLSALMPGPGRAGLAVPVVVGGSTVAVLYVDEGGAGRQTPSAWPELAEVASRHASRCLELLTRAKAAAWRPNRPGAAPDVAGAASRLPGPADAAEVDEEAARRHARLLVSEIRLYNEAAVLEGRRTGDLRHRLTPEIDRARRLYEARIPGSVAERDRVFEEELVHILADGDSALMGPVS